MKSHLFYSLSGLAALLAMNPVQAATINTTTTTPDIFDGVRTDYLQLGNSSGDIGEYSIELASGEVTGVGSIATTWGSASGNGSLALAAGAASGTGSLASGNSASGSHSIAFTDMGQVSGDYSIAIGDVASAFGFSSGAFGSSYAVADYSFASGASSAYGQFSAALGQGNLAYGLGLVVVGRFNDYPMASYIDYELNADGHLFVVGNGTTPSNRSNAFIVYNDGSVDIQTEARVAGDRLLGESELDTNYLRSDAGIQISSSSVTIEPNTYGQVRSLSVGGGLSVGSGVSNGGQGNILGGVNHNIDYANNSIAIGNGNDTYSGQNSAMLGSNNTLYGGSNMLLSGEGLYLSNGINQTAVGQYNDLSPALFMVGNGTGDPADGDDERSNAFEVHPDGRVIINKPQGDVSMGIYGAE